MYLRVAAAIVEVAQHKVLGCRERLRALHVSAAPARHLERAVATVVRDAVRESEAQKLARLVAWRERHATEPFPAPRQLTHSRRWPHVADVGH